MGLNYLIRKPFFLGPSSTLSAGERRAFKPFTGFDGLPPTKAAFKPLKNVHFQLFARSSRIHFDVRDVIYE